MQPLDEARAYRDSVGPAILHSFAELLAIPNVAAMPGGIDRNAIWIRDELMRRGARSAVTQLPGAAPIVFGRIDGEPGGPTIGFYAHFDGQPADDLAWTDPPFTPTLRTRSIEEGGTAIPWPSPGEPVDPEWRIYARGSADDRGAIAALLGALDARQGRRPHSSLVFLLEGEEEIGSPHLGEYLSLLADRLIADIWVICDGPVHQSGRPQVVFGARGIADVEITVFGPSGDLHSGHYGNWAPNPAALLADLVAGMRDERGVPAIDGLEVPAPQAAAAKAASLVPIPGDLGFPVPDGPSLWERNLWPLLNVRGLRAGDVGEASRNVVPRSAVASLDLRLVAGQDPVAVIEAIRGHVAARGFHLVDGPPDAATRRSHRRIAMVAGRPSYPGVLTPVDHPAAEGILAAVEAAAGEAPIVVPSSGSSMPLHHLERLGAPLVIVPIANHDNHQHGPDENMRVANLWYGIDLVAALLG
ncbi:MAG: M20/M25/M40 family metallo-hydrolase [Acidimicrobiia bacterium]|nr:M20/M25/M40 family metallo-hydrolase [Acidimicrobiia bacterium]